MKIIQARTLLKKPVKEPKYVKDGTAVKVVQNSHNINDLIEKMKKEENNEEEGREKKEKTKKQFYYLLIVYDKSKRKKGEKAVYERLYARVATRQKRDKEKAKKSEKAVNGQRQSKKKNQDAKKDKSNTKKSIYYQQSIMIRVLDECIKYVEK